MVSIYTAKARICDDALLHARQSAAMKAGTKSLKNKLNFEFAGGGNLDPKKDKHMHSAC